MMIDRVNKNIKTVEDFKKQQKRKQIKQFIGTYIQTLSLFGLSYVAVCIFFCI